MKKSKKDKYYEDIVTVRLYKDDILKDDVIVSVDGKSMIIPRGLEVLVPRKYAIALMNMEAQTLIVKEVLSDKEIVSKLEDCAKFGFSVCGYAVSLIKRLQDENDDLFYKLAGVMHAVDKWLDGDELNQDEVNRAATMREKTLQITEEQQKEIEKLTLELEGIHGGVDLYKLEYDRAKEEVEWLKEANQKLVEAAEKLIIARKEVEIQAYKKFEKRLKEYSHFTVADLLHIKNLVRELVGDK